jgi:hypothetical protein
VCGNNLAGLKLLLNDEYKESYLSFFYVLVFVVWEAVFVVLYKGHQGGELCVGPNIAEELISNLG